MKASALSFALGLLDDAADVREDIFSDQFNSVVSTIPQEGTASRDELVRHCLREDLAGKAVAVAETILRNLSKRDEGLFGLTCDSLLSSLEGYADFCRLRLVASEAISNAPRRALQQQFG